MKKHFQKNKTHILFRVSALIFCAIILSNSYLKAQTVVNIPDINLRNAICAELGINTADPIYTTDMLNLTRLTVSAVSALTGLHYASNLDTLNLYNYSSLGYLNEISNLTNLLYLNIGDPSYANNSTTALSNIQNLVNLKYLNIENFGINIDLSYLSGLINLEVLYARRIQSPVNLSGLSTLVNLDSLNISDCEISDISALSTLTHLSYLNLFNNNLTSSQLHYLYPLDNLHPVLDLRSNGIGFPNDSINKLCVELASIDSVPGNILYQAAYRSMTLTSDHRIHCSQIDTIGIDMYRLTGDIFIQQKLAGVGSGNTYADFISIQGTPVIVNKFINPAKPRISGNGTLYAFGEEITSGPFLFRVGSGGLIPGDSYPVNYMIDGFMPSGGALSMGNIGTGDIYVQSEFSLFNLKYPFDKIHKYIFQLLANDTNATYFFPQINGFYKYRKINEVVSTETSLNIMINGPLNFGAFMLEDVELKYQGDTLAGGFRIKVPGIPTAPNVTKITQEVFENEPEIIGMNEETVTEEDNEKSTKAYSPFLNIDLRAQFAHGVINGFSCALATDIILGASGLKLTSVKAGVEDLQSPNWRAIGSVNIESAITVPILGPVIAIEDLGVKFGPVYHFEGQGKFKVFGWEVANGDLLYIYDKDVLRVRGNLDLGGLITGMLRTSMDKYNFEGQLNGGMYMPNNLPWKFKSLSGKTIGSVYSNVSGNIISAEIEQFGIPLGISIEYGAPTLPYFHLFLGTNLSNLFQLFKSTAIQNFEVPPNTSQVLIIAGNDTNLFDYTVSSPGGITYNNLNAQYYEKITDSKQTVMVIDNPQSGYWSFNTQQTGPITISVDAIDQGPVGYFTSPGSPQSTDNTIELNCSDYLDTITVRLYYDNDNKDFDGVKLAEYTGINQFDISHVWDTVNVHDGEYYIYCQLDDGKNAFKRFYANGTILIQNSLLSLTPQNLTAQIFNDSLLVSWDMNTDSSIYCTKLTYKDLSTSMVTDIVVMDTNNVMIYDLEKGKSYEIWARYMDMTIENGPMSNKLTVDIVDSTINCPPHFVNNNTAWNYITGEAKTYSLDIIHLDNGPVTYSLVSDTLGFIINQNNISWTPMPWHSGSYTLTIVVTDDSLATDTLLQQIFIIPVIQTQTSVAFNSPQFYSGGSAFVIINDMDVDTNFVSVQLKNLRTAQQLSINCFRSDETRFIGYFDVDGTFTGLADGDTIKVTYTSGGNTYTSTAIYCHFQMGVSDINGKQNELQLYPNPNNGQFYLEFASDNNKKVYWDIFALDGALISSGNFYGKTQQIDMQNTSQGSYIILVKNNNKYHVLKFMLLP